MAARAIIFDFDDTLVQTNVLYEQARVIFFAAMRRLGFCPDAAMAEYLDKADIAALERAGYMAKHCFPQALRDTYIYYCRRQGRLPEDRQAREIEDIGWAVFDQEAEHVPGALELLKALHGVYPLYLLTQGEEDIQQRRLRRSGLCGYFDACYIVGVKDAEAFRAIIAERDIDAAGSWCVGNSLRSDINPALAAGLNAAQLLIDCWGYEQQPPAGEYHQIRELSEFLELIKR
ncbi:MAG: HAD family hydrolase [Bacillota bacterium]|nr:HAD family hydrolase [Bacillota bacterium]